MKRMIEEELLIWKDSLQRKPLIVRGARQVGKTYSIEKFGNEQFEVFAAIDLEKRRDLHRIFSANLGAREILTELEIALERRLSPGKSLLFFDEIQSCPRAIMALRYLYEDCPDLHVIAAGSLIEFALEEISFPVGRVQFLDMHPMTFAEYLWAVNKAQAAELVLSRPKRLSEALHGLLMGELRKYCFIGGMPGSVRAYVETNSLQEVFSVHAELCEAYRQDFPKYARRADPECLDAVLNGAARGLGRRVKYTRLAEEHAHTTNQRAFDLLRKARVLRKVSAADPSGLPLGASLSSRKFKAILVDIGLWQHLCGMRVDREYAKKDLLDVYRGGAAEQLVGQELTASQGSELYYWSREARGSGAEVDYLAVAEGRIFGVEVKSGSAGRLRSLHLLIGSYPGIAGGLVFSSRPYSELTGQKLTFLPLYFAYSATKLR